MTFLYPLGLLALLGIPVLILIYIIKNKYTEQTIASTYIWEMSERFLNRRLPINKLAGLISLILQILAVIFISVLIAHPVFVLHDSAYAYCYVLDASGSMNISVNGVTRFDEAKNRIGGMIEGAADGSTFTLIYSGAGVDTVYKDVTDKDRALSALNSLKVSYVAGDPEKCLTAAQEYFNENRYAVTYLVTDKSYAEHANVNVIDVTENTPPAENYALTGVGYEVTGTSVRVYGNAVSYGGAAQLEIKLTVSENIDGEQIFTDADSLTVGVEEGGTTGFEFICDAIDFQSLEITIQNPDALALDSRAVIYNVRYENLAKTLIVSDGPFYVRAAMVAAGNSNVETVTTKEYTASPRSGYGLYVFDSYSPAQMPADGAVWFINPQGTVTGSDFTFQGGDTIPRNAAVFSTSTNTTVKKLLGGLSGAGFEVYRYAKCGVSGRFTSLASCDGNPVIFTGTNTYGNRETVFAFSLHDSAPFTLSADCSILFSNLLSYSFPSVVENANYYSGETLTVNIPSGCLSVQVQTPNGNSAYVDCTMATGEYLLSEAGSYKLVLTMRDGAERTFNVFAAMPEEERIPVEEGASFSLAGEAMEGKFDGVYDNLIILFILLAVLAAADYGVYCYEQYQLR